MSDSVLKKEFKQQDLQRLRNLVQGKYGDKTSISSGYVKDHIERKEGDVWEEDGRQWTITNGVKQNVTKLSLARKEGNMPLFCPKCKTLMNSQYDRKFYKMNKHCFDCQIKHESQIKKQGKWDEIQIQTNNDEIDVLIKEFTAWTEDLLNESNNSFVTEQGDVENWSKTNKQRILEEKQKAIEYLNSKRK